MFFQTLLLSLTNRCGSKQPEYESPTEHNTEFHPIINNPDNTNLYDTVNESSRSEVDISPKSDEEVLQNQQEQVQNEAKESVKGTPFDSEVEEEQEDVHDGEEKNNEETNKTSEVEDNQKSDELPLKDDEIEETMQNSSSFAEITFEGH